jgi:hypothetical protein
MRKWDARGALGVFAGYRLHPGYAWKGEYLVWELDSFQYSDLRTVSTNHHQGVGTPHVTKVCWLPTTGLIFPLKRDYDRVNMELFDPRIINDEYEPHEEAARVRGYIPEVVQEELSPEANEGLDCEDGNTRDVSSEVTREAMLDDGKPTNKEGDESSEKMNDQLPHHAQSSRGDQICHVKHE